MQGWVLSGLAAHHSCCAAAAAEWELLQVQLAGTAIQTAGQLRLHLHMHLHLHLHVHNSVHRLLDPAFAFAAGTTVASVAAASTAARVLLHLSPWCLGHLTGSLLLLLLMLLLSPACPCCCCWSCVIRWDCCHHDGIQARCSGCRLPSTPRQCQGEQGSMHRSYPHPPPHVHTDTSSPRHCFKSLQDPGLLECCCHNAGMCFVDHGSIKVSSAADIHACKASPLPLPFDSICAACGRPML
jgi:hypothetical protein